MTLEDLTVLRDLGFGMLALLIIYVLGKKVTDSAFKQIQDANKQIEEANKRGEESHNKFIQFIETTYKENTATLERFCNVFEAHLKAKEVTIQMLKEQQQFIQDEVLDRKKQVPKEYRKSSS